LWNGTIVSQGWVVGRRGRRASGQASPREVPSRVVREGGQMGAKPSMRTDQRVGRGMMGTEEAWVVGWERR
jgi:hypothetical protein